MIITVKKTYSIPYGDNKEEALRIADECEAQIRETEQFYKRVDYKNKTIMKSLVKIDTTSKR